MKILLGLACVAAISYGIALLVVRSERAQPEEKEQPTSWPLGDPRLRGFARAFRQN